LLKKDSWEYGRKTNHGRAMTKKIGDRTLVTVIRETNESIPNGTLSAILGDKQTKIGHDGLLKLINKYGI
jgi:hypothetical protein